MQMLNETFTGHLSKFGAKVVDEDVYIEFNITHVSKNESEQTFLDSFSEELNNKVNRCFDYPEWDNIKYSVITPLDIKFDTMDLKATLQTIKVTQKETTNDFIVKYDLTFLKKQEKDADTWFATYLKHKDEDDDGKKYLTEYDIKFTY
jgi:phosphotransferase system IIA component